MKSYFRTPLVTALAAGLALGAFNFGAEAAPPTQPEVQNGATSIVLSARKRHHHVRHYRHSGERAALRTFGLIAGSIASIAAANEWRDHCGYYNCGYYGGYYGYGYAPRHYYRRPYWHRHWNPGYSYRYNHYRHSVHIHP